MLSTAFLIVALILFLIAALPPVPYSGTLQNLGLAFFVASFLPLSF